LPAPSGNAIINGAFEINQRNFTSTTSNAYGFDQWQYLASGSTGTYSAQSFATGAALAVGYEATNFARLAITTGNDNARLHQRIESVKTFAGQTVTLSFYAKGTNPATAGHLAASLNQVFGSGGSAENALPQQTFVLTENWQRYSFTFLVDSISGKTIGTNDHLIVSIGQGSSTSTDSWTLDIWGVQLEAGTVATPFKRNAPSIQAELAACQRYFYRRERVGGNAYPVNLGFYNSGTQLLIGHIHPVEMRDLATLTFSALADFDIEPFDVAPSAIAISGTQTTYGCEISVTDPTSRTTGQAGTIAIDTAGGWIAFSAEL
jgi:hypothetical protein